MSWNSARRIAFATVGRETGLPAERSCEEAFTASPRAGNIAATRTAAQGLNPPVLYVCELLLSRLYFLGSAECTRSISLNTDRRW